MPPPNASASQPLPSEALDGAAGARLRRPRLTPLARRLAEAHGLDPARIAGSGLAGRITRRDIEAAAQRGTPATQAAAPEPARRAAPAPAPMQRGGGEPPAVVPTAWMLVETDLAGVMAAIAQHGPAFAARRGASLTPTAYVLWAAVRALGAQPLLNARWAGHGIALRRSVDLAVVPLHGQTGQQLVPAADRLSLAELAVAAQRTSVAGPEAAATFTVFLEAGAAPATTQPPLPPGQAACLIAGPPRRQLVARDDGLAIRPIMRLGVLFDHRVVDGAPVGRFLRAVRTWLEDRAAHEPLA